MQQPSDQVPHWLYHYYSEGYGKKLKKVNPYVLCLAHYKYTPDFRNYEYRYGICHRQIGNSAVEGKTYVIMKTTVGISNPPKGFFPTTSYIVGYFLVKNKDSSKEVIHMDPKDSLLLLDSPIKITPRIASRFFNIQFKYHGKKSFSQVLGSCTRNRRISAQSAKKLIKIFRVKHYNGSKNYLGNNYHGPMPKKL